MFRSTFISVALALVGFAMAPRAGADDAGASRLDGYAVVRVSVQSEQQLRQVLAITDDVWSHRTGLGEIDVLVAPGDLALLERIGARYEIFIPDVQVLIDAEQARLAAAAAGGGAWYDDFKDNTAILARLQEIVAAHPEIATLIDVGDSIEERDLWAVRVTGPGGGPRPAVVYNACQHAREWISPMVAMYVLEALVDGYGTDPRITGLVNSIEFYVIPVVNPDGYAFTWDVGGDRLWRKNRRNNGGFPPSFGVDNNRNWGYEWGGGGSSGDPASEVYHGTAPFSEPETAAMRDFYIAHPNIVASIDFHSYGELVLYPWAYTDGGPGDGGLHAAIGSFIQEEIQAVLGSIYVDGPVFETLYQASGGSVDWSWGDQGVISYTIELPGTDGGFILPPQYIVPTCKENLPAALALAEAAAVGATFRFLGGPPATIDAAAPTPVDVEIRSFAAGPLQPNTAKLKWRSAGGGALTTVPLAHPGGDSYVATFPAVACGTGIEYHLSIDTLLGLPILEPSTAPAALYDTTSIETTTAFADDFESDLGWVVTNEALLDGQWDRGVPAGGGDRGDPPTDYDGSGACYLTDNEDGNSDVDGGPTILTSPLFDLGGLEDPMLGYARWFSNDDADIDRLDVELSSNAGGTWTLVESVGDTGGWGEVIVRVADYVTPSAAMRVRFRATDNPNDSVTEAAIDKVRFFEEGCPDVSVPGDVDGDGIVDFGDLLAVLAAWGPCTGCPEDLDGSGAVDFADLLLVLANWS
jgi:hypothetical protein